MKRIYLLLFLVAFVSNAFSQNRLSLYIGSANQYAAVELSDFRQRLCVEYGIPVSSLDDYYHRCGNDWGNVGIALEIARTSGRSMRDVCNYYDRYRRYGWDRVVLEIGIKPGSRYYKPFYDRIHHHHDVWDQHYYNYCERHGKHHPKNHKYKAKHKKKYDNGYHRGYDKRYKKKYHDDDDDDDDYDD
ncbi:hypothetical protein [Massilibacteroides vaginae]|uniref:hypothetical protein n=1 Tax=Massilibacteroides vaginae TaxID=1673718 RepID=UPI000A1CBC09|nr:hypothetical protein [Massilibacteroides vaginae]